MNCFLGIDTSNYTTSCALADESGQVLLSLRKLLEVRAGERGLRQSDALFAHIKNLPALMEELREKAPDARVAAVGVSDRPRSVAGSYMPVFLAGVSAASAAASSLGVPLFRFSHQQGHVAAAAYGSEDALGNRFLSFHVSGGTTELLLVRMNDGIPEAERIGGTADLNAGQAIDRAGVAMGLSFPAGAAMDELALAAGSVPERAKPSVRGLECNLSGIENKVSAMISNGRGAEETAAYLFDFIALTLRALTLNAREEYGELPVLFAGGVMSSRYILRSLSELGNVRFARDGFSADNAAGTALLCRRSFKSLPQD
ncbi:MAG: peptidase M22 [Clostridia bacterium]|nr:peptidase M22 [Clostridia bacterium]